MRIIITLDMQDDEPAPEVGQEIYIGAYADGMDERYLGGLTGYVERIEPGPSTLDASSQARFKEPSS
jgi:hypothetical protein